MEVKETVPVFESLNISTTSVLEKTSQSDECQAPGQACKDKSMKRCQHFAGLQAIRLVAHEMLPAWDAFPL